VNLGKHTEMKTGKSPINLRMLLIALIAIISITSLSAQIIGASVISQSAEEVRKGYVSTYSISGNAADEYSWQVIGGIVKTPSAGISGTGTAADPYIVPFTVGLQAIEVQWSADDNTINSFSGNVSAQLKVSNGTAECTSKIQSLDVLMWSQASLRIQDSDYELCSGDATHGPITVQFSGAPDFDYKYTVTNMDGTIAPEVIVTGAKNATQTILIPANLVNSSNTADQKYIVTITEMNDSFAESGIILDASFTITVHPSVSTKQISSSKTLIKL